MPVNLYYTQRVRGFQQENVKYLKNSVEIQLKRTKHQCPYCGSTRVTVEPVRRRQIRGEPLGSCRNVVLEFTIHRLYCHRCHHREMEHIPFSPLRSFEEVEKKQTEGGDNGYGKCLLFINFRARIAFTHGTNCQKKPESRN